MHLEMIKLCCEISWPSLSKSEQTDNDRMLCATLRLNSSWFGLLELG